MAIQKSNELEKLVGKLVVGKVQGFKLDHECRHALETGLMGGVTLFKDNADNLAQLIDLIGEIHSICPETPLISSDNEGGAIQRFDHILTPLPSAMSMAASKEKSWIPYLINHTASELKMLGINFLLAPVLDICDNALNPIVCTRSYGSNPKSVGEIGLKVIQTLKEAKVLSVAKHFPGHGSTLEDSHLHLAVSPATSEALWQKELVPFRHVINQVPAIMTGHIWFEAIDEEPLPASLSPRIVGHILREYLKYDGLVVSDDLTMKAISDRWGLAEAAVMAIVAGTDQVLVCGTIDEIRSVHKGIMKACSTGRISEERLKTAVARVESAKATVAPFVPAKSPQEKQKLMAAINASVEKGKALTKEFAVKSIALIKGKVPDVSQGSWVVVAPKQGRYPMQLVEHLRKKAGDAPAKKRPEFTEIRYVIDPAAELCQNVADLVEGKNVIFLTFRARQNPGQIQLAAFVAKSAAQVIHVATDAPFDIQSMPHLQNSIATFDPSELAMSAAAEILFGEWSPTGTSPVELNMAAKC